MGLIKPIPQVSAFSASPKGRCGKCGKTQTAAKVRDAVNAVNAEAQYLLAILPPVGVSKSIPQKNTWRTIRNQLNKKRRRK